MRAGAAFISLVYSLPLNSQLNPVPIIRQLARLHSKTGQKLPRQPHSLLVSCLIDVFVTFRRDFAPGFYPQGMGTKLNTIKLSDRQPMRTVAVFI